MKYINLNNDYGIDREKDKEAASDKEITINWIRHAIVTAHPSMPSDKRRIFASMASKMEKTLKADADYLGFNPMQYLFLTQAFEVGASKPEFALSITVAENAVLAAVDELPANSTTVE